MENAFRIALAQINTTVGDIEGNERKMISSITEAKGVGADLVAFPELAVTGYPPEDLLLKPQCIKKNIESVRRIAVHCRGITAIVGFADAQKGKVQNAAAILHGGRVAAVYHKICLPNYGVFDEKRYFEPGERPLVFELRGARIGVSICEDIWIPEGVPDAQAIQGNAELLVNISSSPYHAGKGREREKIVSVQAKKNRAIVAYLNLVGGQDELVFDGLSFVFNEEGKLLTQGRQFEEDFLICDCNVERVRRIRAKDRGFQKRVQSFKSDYDVETVRLRTAKQRGAQPAIRRRPTKRLPYLEEIYQALVLGTRDYVRKNGFEKVVIGLSGGIDSALTAAIATDALGRENVIGVTMPSQYSSMGSVTDSEKLTANLRIELKHISIREAFNVLRGMLKEEFRHLSEDSTEENIQARIRGIIIMALSNKFGWLVLAPGNKSEISMGYCTLYGDMVGGFAVIKDVPKTLVYKLSRFRNRLAGGKLIPQSIIDKAPSAELKPDQKDTDNLPPYEILDPVLEAYVEQDKSIREIVAMGYDENLVKRVAVTVDRNEYKRRQGPPGIKITPRAFGKDRRIPITNRYRD
jgi:NAD+ synthase (glutamine-hydrolysing)